VLRESAVEKGCAYLEGGRHRRAVSLYEVVFGEVEDQVECAGDLPGGSRSERRDGIVRLDVRLRVQDLALDLRDEQAAERLGREAPHPAQVSLERGPSHLAQEAAQREIDAQVAVRGRQALGGGGCRPLVIGRLGEADRERLHGAPRLGDGQGGDAARVEAAREEGPPGYVGDQPAAYRLAQEVEDALAGLPPRRADGPGRGRRPV